MSCLKKLSILREVSKSFPYWELQDAFPARIIPLGGAVFLSQRLPEVYGGVVAINMPKLLESLLRA